MTKLLLRGLKLGQCTDDKVRSSAILRTIGCDERRMRCRHKHALFVSTALPELVLTQTACSGWAARRSCDEKKAVFHFCCRG